MAILYQGKPVTVRTTLDERAVYGGTLAQRLLGEVRYVKRIEIFPDEDLVLKISPEGDEAPLIKDSINQDPRCRITGLLYRKDRAKSPDEIKSP